jgi:hypothetical protein
MCALLSSLQVNNFTINFGPQHPAAHGVLRLVLEMKGEHQWQQRQMPRQQQNLMHFGCFSSRCSYASWLLRQHRLQLHQTLGPSECLALEMLLDLQNQASMVAAQELCWCSCSAYGSLTSPRS